MGYLFQPALGQLDYNGMGTIMLNAGVQFCREGTMSNSLQGNHYTAPFLELHVLGNSLSSLGTGPDVAFAVRFAVREVLAPPLRPSAEVQ